MDITIHHQFCMLQNICAQITVGKDSGEFRGDYNGGYFQMEYSTRWVGENSVVDAVFSNYTVPKDST